MHFDGLIEPVLGSSFILEICNLFQISFGLAGEKGTFLQFRFFFVFIGRLIVSGGTMNIFIRVIILTFIIFRLCIRIGLYFRFGLFAAIFIFLL